ncbi:serine/threonine protein kinase [Candidatus Uabimicrobium sp. HlEnr_7]|uniref:serine/threonine protein kinase n=1 Tax=Candidatus Uabimicrobium helgolandensis TaxID=3095367 RepID=UPI003557F562
MSGHKTRRIDKKDLLQKEFSLSEGMIDQIIDMAKISDESVMLLDKNEIIDSRYQIVSKLGQGGMGVVYQVKDKFENKALALKITIVEVDSSDTEEKKRFKREIETMRKLQHPNIMKIYCTGEYKNHLFYTMEYVKGKPFYEFLRQGIPLNKGVEIIAQISHAVHLAHQNSIIHRDLKPDNILITEGLQPVLMDFGIAKIIEYHTELTKSGFIMGTPFYMSPEQALGKKVDHLSDVYSLGVILYEFISGFLPFTGESNRETLAMVVNNTPDPPISINPNVNKKLNDICLKALSKRKEDRYSSAQDFALDLQHYLENSNILKKSKKKRALLVLTNVIILIILTLLVYYFQS